MNSVAQSSRPTPERIFQSLGAYQVSAAMKAAIDLDVFSAIGGGADTTSAIASRCKISERGARILCDYLTVHEFLTKARDRYSLAPDAAVFLDRKSPTCIGSCANFMASTFLHDEFRRLTDAVRKGGTMMESKGSLAPEHPKWVEFARSMAPLQSITAEMIAELLDADPTPKGKILDVAAGHGMFGIALARYYPNAEIYALDWAPVLQVARENAEKAGVSARYHTLPGDAFEADFGSNYDLVLLTNFLHHYDAASIEAFLRKVHSALKPGGRAVTLEFVPNEDRVSPPAPAAFALVMLATTPAGDAYPFAEYEKMFRKAGFSENRQHVLPTSHSVIISTK